MGKDKYIFDEMAIGRDCYHLATLFMSSRSIRDMQDANPEAQFHHFSIFERQEIKRLLISISIQLRMIDDLMKNHDRRDYIPATETGMIEYENPIDSKKMSLRDACNKVIHAKSLSIFTEDDDHRVVLEGDETKKGEWKATIFIIPYLDSALNLIKSYDEDWDVSAY